MPFLKKVILIPLISIFSTLFLFYFGMFLLTLDPKDSCLDQGGSYNDVTKICEKS
ncbi:hypothetical protein GVX86_10575 [[Haemophilus] felis]|nr:hypothetical protein [[Haemophilus] felis]NBI43984.1 hypothetical protein [[Haemophilus] felis]